jgi:hypothetical protein
MQAAGPRRAYGSWLRKTKDRHMPDPQGSEQPSKIAFQLLDTVEGRSGLLQEIQISGMH